MPDLIRTALIYECLSQCPALSASSSGWVPFGVLMEGNTPFRAACLPSKARMGPWASSQTGEPQTQRLKSWVGRGSLPWVTPTPPPRPTHLPPSPPLGHTYPSYPTLPHSTASLSSPAQSPLTR